MKNRKFNGVITFNQYKKEKNSHYISKYGKIRPEGELKCIINLNNETKGFILNDDNDIRKKYIECEPVWIVPYNVHSEDEFYQKIYKFISDNSIIHPKFNTSLLLINNTDIPSSYLLDSMGIKNINRIDIEEKEDVEYETYKESLFKDFEEEKDKYYKYIQKDKSKYEDLDVLTEYIEIISNVKNVDELVKTNLINDYLLGIIAYYNQLEEK